jgi:hypothetical protein
VFDDQHNLWTNVFASVVFVVHRMLKLLGQGIEESNTSKRRHYEDQVKSKKRSKCCQADCLCEEHRTVCARSTGLYGATRRTVRCHTPDCPVPHAGLSGAPGNVALMASSRWHYGEKTTGLSGVTSGVSGVKRLRANGRLQCQTNG